MKDVFVGQKETRRSRDRSAELSNEGSAGCQHKIRASIFEASRSATVCNHSGDVFGEHIGYPRNTNDSRGGFV